MTPNKVPVINKHEYTIWLENYQNIATFIHADVRKYNKTVRAEFGEDLDKLVELHNFPLYVLTEKDNHKLRKFMAMYRFKFDHEPICNDGVKRLVYRLDRR